MAGKVEGGLVVEDSHFEYLRLQKGKLDPWAHDRAAWLERYEIDLQRTFESIRPYLPVSCWGVLDIGSGLGGIDVLLYRHYAPLTNGRGPFVNLLDGEDNAPQMRLHRETFNSMAVARDFLTKNGVPGERFGYVRTREKFVQKPYDLVVSFGSWCFHYPPEVYLPLLLGGGGLHVDSIIVVDLRRDRPLWERQLFGAGLRPIAVVREETKYRRIVFAKQ